MLITVAETIELHDKIILASGGSPGMRDAGLLESAIMGCYQSFDGVDLYPSVIEKSARIAYSICKNHPFVDGNKRTAVMSMLMTLRMNDIILKYPQKDLVTLGVGIEENRIDYEGIVAWIKNRLL